MNYVEQFDILGTIAHVRDKEAQSDISTLKNNVVNINSEIADINTKLGAKRKFLIIGDEYGIGNGGWTTILKPQLISMGFECNSEAVTGLSITGVADIVNKYQGSAEPFTDLIVCVGKNGLGLPESSIVSAFSKLSTEARTLNTNINIFIGCLDFQSGVETYRLNAPKQRKIFKRCCGNYGMRYMDNIHAVLPSMVWQGLDVFTSGNASLNTTSGAYVTVYIQYMIKYGKADIIFPYNAKITEPVRNDLFLYLNIVDDCLEINIENGLFTYTTQGWDTSSTVPISFGGNLVNSSGSQVTFCDSFLGIENGEIADSESNRTIANCFGLYIQNNQLAFSSNAQISEDTTIPSGNKDISFIKNNTLYVPLINL